MDPNSVGDVSISVTGDLSDLQPAFDQAEQMAQQAGDQIAQSFGSAAGPVNQLDSSVENLGNSLANLAGLSLTIGGIQQLAKDSLDAYANIEKATIALTDLTGSGEKAAAEIQGLRDLANADALSFPALLTANQRMTAFGISASAIPSALKAAADAAAATGNSFDAITNSITRLSESGAAGARQLTQLGLSTKDLAAVMGVSADQVAAAFKALDPTDRVNVIVEALQKYQGAAQQTADSISGQWTRLQNETEQAFEQIGAALAPAATALGDLAAKVIPLAADAASQLAGLSGDIVKFGASIVDAGKEALNAVDPTHQWTAELSALATMIKQSGASITDVFVPGITGLRDGLALGTLAIQTFTGTGPQFAQMSQAVADGFTRAGTAAKVGGDQFKQAWNASLAATNLDPVTAGTKAVETEQTKLASAVQSASDALAQLNRHYQDGLPLLDGHKVTLTDIAIATDTLTKAQKALNDTNVNYQFTLSGLATEYAKQQASAAVLEQTIAALLSTTNRTAEQENLLYDAMNKLDGITKQLTNSVTSLKVAAQGPGLEFEKLTTSADALTMKAIGLTAAVNDSKAALDALVASNDHSQAGVIALGLAVDQYTKALKNAGQSENDLITITQNGVQVQTTAAAMLGQLKDQTGSLIATQQNGVTVLGQEAQAHTAATSTVQQHVAALTALQQAQLNAQNAAAQTITDEQNYVAAAQNTITSLKIHAQAVIDLTAAQDGSIQKYLALQSAISAYTSLVNSSKLSTDQLDTATQGLSSDLGNLVTAAGSAGSAIAGLSSQLSAADSAMNAFVNGTEKLGSGDVSGLDAFATAAAYAGIGNSGGNYAETMPTFGISASQGNSISDQLANLAAAADPAAAAVSAVAKAATVAAPAVQTLAQQLADATTATQTAITNSLTNEAAGVVNLQTAVDAAQASYDAAIAAYEDGTGTMDKVTTATQALQNAQLTLTRAQSQLTTDQQFAGVATSTLTTAVSTLGTTSQAASTALTAAFATVGAATVSTTAAVAVASQAVLAQFAQVQAISAILGGGSTNATVPTSTSGGASSAIFALTSPAFGGSGSSAVGPTSLTFNFNNPVLNSPQQQQQVISNFVQALRQNTGLKING